MTSRNCFGTASLLLGLLSGCALAGADMAAESTEVMALEVDPEDEAEDFGHVDVGALADGAGYAPPDGRDPFSTLGVVWTGDVPEPPPPPPPPAPLTLEGKPLFAQAGDDDSADDCEDPTPEEDGIDLQSVAKDLTQAKKPKDRVEIQQRVIEENLDDADDLNDELARIIEELRREQGLQEQQPYISPTQQVVEPIIEREDVEANPEKVAQQIQEQLEEPRAEEERPPDEEGTAAPPQDQDQDQTPR